MKTDKSGKIDSELFSKEFNRRAFIKSLALISGLFYSACSDIRILLGLYPDKYNEDKNLIERVLASFAATVIPGADERDENLIKIFSDEFYPFHKFCGFFVYDLCTRSKDLFDEEKFYNLNQKKRSEVISNGLKDNDGGNVARLYEFAIYMTQVSFYAGIYDDGKGCSLIGFKGRNTGYLSSEMIYAESNFYLAPEITNDGNFN